MGHLYPLFIFLLLPSPLGQGCFFYEYLILSSSLVGVETESHCTRRPVSVVSSGHRLIPTRFLTLVHLPYRKVQPWFRPRTYSHQNVSRLLELEKPRFPVKTSFYPSAHPNVTAPGSPPSRGPPSEGVVQSRTRPGGCPKCRPVPRRTDEDRSKGLNNVLGSPGGGRKGEDP